MLPVTVHKRVSNLIVFAGPITTLAISPWFNFDPINLIKVLVLTCISFTAFGLLIPYLFQLSGRIGKALPIILIWFCAAMLSSFIFSGANKSQQFWGVFGRNTGILSYFSLCIILLVTALLNSRVAFLRISWSLIATVTVMSGYCLIQIAKLDPISWSAFFPFGTLGNVNFLSGFMGLGLVTVFIFATSKQFEKRERLFLSGLFIIGLFVLLKSDSTQGMVALVVGIATFSLVKSWFYHKSIFLLTALCYTSGFVSLVLGLLDKGPLRGLIYQFTVLYRADYMHAGISMLLNKPFTGVGIDSYDDWYRAERGTISAVRNSLSRTANSAHNISLDIASGGGFPLLLAYISLLAAIGWAILVGLRKGRAKDPVFMAIAMSWVAYQVQASVSINQIGVGVWGWILGGALLGYSKLGRISEENPKTETQTKMERPVIRSRNGTPNTPPAISVVWSSLFLGLGFVLSFLPLKTDADFAKASKAGSASLLLEVTNRTSANAFMLQKTAVDTFQSNLPDIAKTINERLKSRFPRNIGGWFITHENSIYTQSEKMEAIKVIAELDPIVYLCYSSDPNAEFRKILDELPGAEKYKLARGWGLAKALPKDSTRNYSFAAVPSDALLLRIRSFCGY